MKLTELLNYGDELLMTSTGHKKKAAQINWTALVLENLKASTKLIDYS